MRCLLVAQQSRAGYLKSRKEQKESAILPTWFLWHWKQGCLPLAGPPWRCSLSSTPCFVDRAKHSVVHDIFDTCVPTMTILIFAFFILELFSGASTPLMARQTHHLASGASNRPCKIKLAPVCTVDPPGQALVPVPAKTNWRSADYEWLARWPVVAVRDAFRLVTKSGGALTVHVVVVVEEPSIFVWTQGVEKCQVKGLQQCKTPMLESSMECLNPSLWFLPIL